MREYSMKNQLGDQHARIHVSEKLEATEGIKAIEAIEAIGAIEAIETIGTIGTIEAIMHPHMLLLFFHVL